MRIKYVMSIAAVIAFSGVASAEVEPAPVPLPSVELPPPLARVLRDYETAWMANQPVALARLFTADGMALPNGRPPARGATQIAAEYAKVAGAPLSLRALAYSVSGDMAYIVGGFAPVRDQPDFGKFVLVLRRAPDGRWKIAADMDNMNAMPRRLAPEHEGSSAPAHVPTPESRS
jgi:ketosteroid isomerase-like protein